MLRLALCGLGKVQQGGCWAAWHVYATSALTVPQSRQQGPLLGSGAHDPWAAQQQWGGLPFSHCLHQQQPYSQHNQPPKAAQQQRDSSADTPAGAAAAGSSSSGSSSSASGSEATNSSSSGSNAVGTAASSNSSSSNPSSRSGSSNGSSSAAGAPGNGGDPGRKQRPAADAAASKSSSKKHYTGATTAADHIRRSTAAASAQQQLEPPGKQQKQQQLLAQSQPNLQALPAASSSRSNGAAARQRPEHQPVQEQHQQLPLDKPPSQQSWEQESKHYSAAQQQQWQSQTNYQKQPPQQQQYKIVQYSKGVSLTLALSAQPSGDYSLLKTKGVASAADLAAFGRTKPTKEGAAAAAKQKVVKEVPLLLRPVHPYYLRVKKALQATFLPSGYPTSVGSNYLQYTLWQAVTNFATTANGVLASTFLLYSVGLGAGAIPTAGALNWVLKDGLGQMGTLLFGKAIAHNFDIHSKTWYFMSFLLLSTATGLEIATILVPDAFLVLGSCANMIKGLSWMAGGSTRSVFNLSFVRDNNIADITAKNTSQYIFASLFGTTAGVSCCAYIGQSAPLALLCFSGLAYTSMYSAYRTVKAIPLPTLNSTRLQLLAARYLKCVRTTATDGFPGVLSYERQHGFMSYQQEYEVPEDEDDTCELELPSPLDLAELDNPLPWVVGDPRLMNPGIHVGSQLDRLVEGQPGLLVVVLNTFRYSRYLLVPERNAIHLVLHAEAQPRDMVQAYLQACILRKCLKTGQSLSPDNLPELRIILHDTLLAAENLTPAFMRALARQGWQTEKIVVEAHRRRARW